MQFINVLFPMKNIKIYSWLLLLQIWFIVDLTAQQTTLHVVTQTIQKEWDWQPNKLLIINGENAIITVKVWDKNSIQATAELIAKHPQKSIAERDIQAQKIITEYSSKSIVLGNQLILTKGMEKPKSNLKAAFTIYTPADCALRIKNRFGQIDIEGIQNTVSINSQFTKLNLKDIKGKINLTSNFGDIIGLELTGQVAIDANRSDIQLDKPSGNFKIKAKYGIVTILEDKTRQFDLDIKGNKANVIFIDPVLIAHNFRLATEFGEINVPSSAAFKFIENSKQRKEAVLNKIGNASQISVALSFGDITFQ